MVQSHLEAAFAPLPSRRCQRRAATQSNLCYWPQVSHFPLPSFVSLHCLHAQHQHRAPKGNHILPHKQNLPLSSPPPTTSVCWCFENSWTDPPTLLLLISYLHFTAAMDRLSPGIFSRQSNCTDWFQMLSSKLLSTTPTWSLTSLWAPH